MAFVTSEPFLYLLSYLPEKSSFYDLEWFSVFDVIFIRSLITEENWLFLILKELRIFLFAL